MVTQAETQTTPIGALQHAPERSDNTRIELLAGFTLDVLEGGRDPAWQTVRTRRYHRRERVGNRDDTRGQRYRVARQTFRIAGAVPPLVVVTDDVLHHLREVDRCQQLEGGIDMVFHATSPFSSQLRFRDQALQRHLAEVAEHRAQRNGLQLFFVEPYFFGDGRREEAGLAGATAEERVAVFQEAHQQVRQGYGGRIELAGLEDDLLGLLQAVDVRNGPVAVLRDQSEVSFAKNTGRLFVRWGRRRRGRRPLLLAPPLGAIGRLVGFPR